jgi:hypothetical protein
MRSRQSIASMYFYGELSISVIIAMRSPINYEQVHIDDANASEEKDETEQTSS